MFLLVPLLYPLMRLCISFSKPSLLSSAVVPHCASHCRPGGASSRSPLMAAMSCARVGRFCASLTSSAFRKPRSPSEKSSVCTNTCT